MDIGKTQSAWGLPGDKGAKGVNALSARALCELCLAPLGALAVIPIAIGTVAFSMRLLFHAVADTPPIDIGAIRGEGKIKSRHQNVSI